jgi:lysophospholipase L1-like esterase
MKDLHLKEEMQHGVPDFPVQYYNVDSSHPRYEMALHWHREFEIVRVRSGALELYVNNVSKVLGAGDIAFIEFGGNDSDFDWRAISADPSAKHLPKTPIAEYEKDMREMIGIAQEAGMSVILSTLPPIISERYFDFFSQGGLNRDNILAWLGDKNKIYRFHERYSLALARLSRECGCRLLDLRAAFLEKWDPKPYYCRDGIHPNVDGQILLGEATLAAIS